MVSSGKLSVFPSNPRICLNPNGRLSFQMLCIPSDRSSRHRQTRPRMRDSSASSVAHPVMQMCGTRTVSLRDLAHCPSDPMDATKYSQADPSETVEANAPILTTDVHPDPEPWSPIPMRETRRSTHEIKPPSRYGW